MDQVQIEADKIKQLQQLVLELDVEFLEKALADMKSQHTWRDAAAILNPNPFSHFEKQELESAKLKQLQLYIELAKNSQEIMKNEVKYAVSKKNEGSLAKMFL